MEQAGVKLMPLGLTNQIVNDSDSKPADFNRQFRSDSISNDDRDFDIKLIKFDLFLIKINHF